MASKMILYCVDGSPPVRSVYLCLEALSLPHQRKMVQVLKKEQFSPDFLKLNPQHTVPTLDDSGVVIWDSHAINAYLVTKYGKDDSLYPKDPAKRAIVDQRLHFDSGILFPLFRKIAFSLFTLGNKEIAPEYRKEAAKAYNLLEKFLGNQNFLTGDNYTIADFCCVATVSTIVEAFGITPEAHPRVKSWLQRCKEVLPGYKTSQDRGLRAFKTVVDRALNRNQSKL